MIDWIYQLLKANPDVTVSLAVVLFALLFPLLGKGRRKPGRIFRERLETTGAELCLVGFTVFVGALFDSNSKLVKKITVEGPGYPIVFFILFIVAYASAYWASQLVQVKWKILAKNRPQSPLAGTARPSRSIGFKLLGGLLLQHGIGICCVWEAWKFP